MMGRQLVAEGVVCDCGVSRFEECRKSRRCRAQLLNGFNGTVLDLLPWPYAKQKGQLRQDFFRLLPKRLVRFKTENELSPAEIARMDMLLEALVLLDNKTNRMAGLEPFKLDYLAARLESIVAMG